MKLFAAKPNANLGGSIETGTGRFNRVNLRGSLNVPLAEGLYARVSGTYDKRDGYFRLLDYGCANPGSGVASQTSAGDCVTGTQGGVDVLSLRGALRYAPAGSKLDVTISGDYARNNSEPPATKLTLANRAVIAPALSLQDYRTYVAGNPVGGVPFDSRFLTGPKSYSSYENYSGSGNYTTIFGFPAQVVPGTFTDRPENSTETWAMNAPLQAQGAAIDGRAQALVWQLIVQEAGAVQTVTISDFPLLRITEKPAEIALRRVRNDFPPTGRGEQVLLPVIPAVANAIRAATGKRLRSLPLQLA